MFNLKNWLWNLKKTAKLHHIKKSQDDSHLTIRYAEIISDVVDTVTSETETWLKFRDETETETLS